MKIASQAITFNPRFPERFNWELIDSEDLSAAVQLIIDAIEQDSTTHTQVHTPGLRLALNRIALIATLPIA